MLRYATKKTDLQTACSECEILEDRLNAATDSIVQIVNKVFTNAEEKSQELTKAEGGRDHVLRDLLEHLRGHNRAVAA